MEQAKEKFNMPKPTYDRVLRELKIKHGLITTKSQKFYVTTRYLFGKKPVEKIKFLPAYVLTEKGRKIAKRLFD